MTFEEARKIDWSVIYTEPQSFELITRWFKRLDENLGVEGDHNEIYFPMDLPRPREPMVFIEGGGFNGDTLDQIARLRFKVDTAISCEPIPQYYHDLKNNAVRIKRQYPDWKLFVVNYALAEENKTLPFIDTGIGVGGVAVGGKVFDDVVWDAKERRGKIDIPCTTLDSILKRMGDMLGESIKPNFIKLDVEGMELEALKGSIETIKAYRPRLAVCVYHFDYINCDGQKEMYEVPLWIHELGLDYELRLRQHFTYPEIFWQETVLYAIPKEDFK